MKKTKIITIMVLLITLLTGCNMGGDKTSARTIKDPADMPEIVFMNIIDYSDIADEGGLQEAISFYDKYGNHYTSKDQYVCTLPYAELVKEFAAGNIDDKIDYHMSCDADELFQNYEKLCELSKNENLEMEYPTEVSQVETENRYWLGLYYDKNGEIRSLLLHEFDVGEYYANDERANEIYEWYMGTFKKNQVVKEEKEEIIDTDKLAVFDLTGRKYFKNQVLIRVNEGTESTKVEKTAEEYGVEIVGFDETKNEYIFEFKEEKTLDELILVIDELWYYPFVDRTSLHFYD